MPMFVEKTFAVLIAAVYGFTSVWVLAEAKFIPLGSEVWIFGVALVPVGLSVHALRKSFLSKHQLLTALTNFELESSTCSSDFDRRFILRCIVRWYGGPEQFESFVRKDLREELLAQIRETSFRSGHPGRTEQKRTREEERQPHSAREVNSSFIGLLVTASTSCSWQQSRG